MQEVTILAHLYAIQLNTKFNMHDSCRGNAPNSLRVHSRHIGPEESAERCARRAANKQVWLLRLDKRLGLDSLTFKCKIPRSVIFGIVLSKSKKNPGLRPIFLAMTLTLGGEKISAT